MKQLFSDADLDKWFDIFEENAESAIYEKLKEAGEYFVRLARESGTYQDRTGNLRSSIGYVIVKDGSVLLKNFMQSDKGTDRNTGLKKAERLAVNVASNVKGLVLIGVAGMDYAMAVEAGGERIRKTNKKTDLNGKSYDTQIATAYVVTAHEVISSSALQTEMWLKKSIQTIFKLAA